MTKTDKTPPKANVADELPDAALDKVAGGNRQTKNVTKGRE